MHDDAIKVLEAYRTMAVTTLRSDGWPQTTFVGYANKELSIYFLIFRTSQKFGNLQRDERMSLAVGGDAKNIRDLTAVYAGAKAKEITDPQEREDAWRLLVERHPNLIEFEAPDFARSALIKAECRFVTLLDYRKGPGHREEFIIGEASGDLIAERRKLDEWGIAATE